MKKRTELFAGVYLKNELPLRIPEFHIEIYRDFDNQSLKRLAYIAPTGFGKSTVQFACAIKAICYAEYKEILIISATAEFAEFKLRKIKSEIENNDALREDFQIDPSDVWRDNEIVLNNGVRVYAKGKGAQVTGYRPDLILADDIETETESRSEIERAHLKEWWYSTVMNRPSPEGRIIIIGSISSKLAWMNEFSTDDAKNAGWRTKPYSTKGCKTIWSAKWSDQDLERKKKELAAYPGLYEALYESDVSQIQKYAFRKDWLRYYDKAPANLSVFTTVDPAIGERLDNDFSSIITGGIDQYGNIFILDCIKRRFNVETLELFGALFTVYEVFKPVKIGIETVGFQKFIKLFFEQECRKRGKYPQVVEIKHDTKTTKAMRITSLAPVAQTGQLFIRPDMFDLISEWEAYPEVEHDDVLDALSMFKDLAMARGVGANTGRVPRPEMGIGNTI